jgi:predicted alpha/beta superfamily hydrolase
MMPCHCRLRRHAIAWLAAGLHVALTSQAECATASPGTPIEIGRHEAIWSEVLRESRPLQIHVPRAHEERHAACPVIYVLDGAGNFAHTVAAAQFLAEAGRIPDSIVVAIPNVDRARDLTPNLPGCGDDCGRGDRFLEFLTEELIPWVESRYRTAPFRILTGHSRGGLYAFHTLLTQPDAFNAYVAMSPALWWNREAALSGAEGKLRALPPRRFLYVTDGDESADLTSAVAKAVTLLQRAAPRNLSWHYAHLANEEHMTTRHRSIYDGLEHIFSGMQVPAEVIRARGMAGIEAHYATLEARYGFPIPLPMGMVEWCGYYLLQQEKAPMAVDVFKRSTELFPTEGRAHYGLASALSAAGREGEAHEAMTQAFRIAQPW